MQRNRARFTTTWTIYLDHDADFPFSQPADFGKIAERALVKCMAHYDPALQWKSITPYGDQLMDVVFTWDINLDMVPGYLHQPMDHMSLMMSRLKIDLPHYTNRLKVDRVESVSIENGQERTAPWGDLDSYMPTPARETVDIDA